VQALSSAERVTLRVPACVIVLNVEILSRFEWLIDLPFSCERAFTPPGRNSDHRDPQLRQDLRKEVMGYSCDASVKERRQAAFTRF
jgi:hypothetical protein